MTLSRIRICAIILMQIVIVFCQDGPNKGTGGETKILTEKTCKFDQEAGHDHSVLRTNIFCIDISDSKLFQIRRKETKELLNIIAKEENYEKRYKLVEAAYGKLLKVVSLLKIFS